MSPKLAFYVFRQQMHTIQGVLEEHLAKASPNMCRWAERIPTETIVLVKGELKPPKEPVKSATFHDLEVAIESIHIIAEPTETLPMSVYEDDSAKRNIPDRTKLDNRIIDLRTPSSQALFRLNSALCSLFRSFLIERGFIEIHTPKLQGGATESGASVFTVEYFGRDAFLAQSPQLAKQMCIAADMGRVFEIGPVFRAENSNTHRHLTEYTGLDIEMALHKNYHEALRFLTEMLKFIFAGLYKSYRKEIEVLKRAFPHEDLVWKEETPIIPFKEGVRMLTESGWRGDDGEPLSEYEDLGTRDEIRLGELVKEKYQTDFYVLDKFPAEARPFYAMLDSEDDRLTNSFDMFVRGQEILTGGQRIHDAEMLLSRMKQLFIQPVGALEEYVQGFKWGCPPHAGAGIGLERILMLVFNLGNIRFASLFPRDPRSLPAPKEIEPMLRHPDCDTLFPPWVKSEVTGDLERETETGETIPIEPPKTMEEVEDLMPFTHMIANYGDASNTSALDDRYSIWRSLKTGAAVGYSRATSGYIIVVGDPLCHKSQYAEVIKEFLDWVKSEKVGRPIWILVCKEVEGILNGSYEWRCISCVAEDRIDPKVNRAHADQVVMKKVRHARKEGVEVTSLTQGQLPSQEIMDLCEQRMEEWKAGRKSGEKGKQVHLTDLNPWTDYEHRTYVYATTRPGGTNDSQDTTQASKHTGPQTVHALVVLTQLSPQHGYQVKWALEFPGAPSGTIEAAVLGALDTASETGASSVTFGAGAMASVMVDDGAGLKGKGVLVKMLQHSYHAIATELKLLNKSEFRQKMGATEDPIWVCFPKRSLGPGGIRALLKFFQDEGTDTSENNSRVTSRESSMERERGSLDLFISHTGSKLNPLKSKSKTGLSGGESSSTLGRSVKNHASESKSEVQSQTSSVVENKEEGMAT
ncbi:Aminoacyl-tRNA synthetase [Dendrothele bispora CBS 962.96]|uniref:aspartate--tRNA ligase n=1 Tax=Dendrothele bispora (strain CBS 962.96) TaxID=1314807 RepID=A0A4S8MX38_DENBC|nr:Aminoacyl-tRNA synthetase [Dendrothele bispora CBS 962.96]